MGFIDKFEKAGYEFEKEMKDGDAMIMIAVDGGGENDCATIYGAPTRLSLLLACTAIRDEGFKKILLMAVKAVEKWEEEKNNK